MTRTHASWLYATNAGHDRLVETYAPDVACCGRASWEPWNADGATNAVAALREHKAIAPISIFMIVEKLLSVLYQEGG